MTKAHPRYEIEGKKMEYLHFALVALGAGIGEAFIYFLLIGDRIGPVVAMMGHIAIVGLLAFWTFRVPSPWDDLRFPFLLTVTTTVLGPLGPLGSLLILPAWFHRSTQTFEEWYESLFPEAVVPESVKLLQRLQGEDVAGDEEHEVGVTSFADVLSTGTLEQKVDVVTIIAREYRPAFAPALKMALNDEHNAVRIQAAAAVATIEDIYSKKTLQVTQEMKENPERTDLWLALARLAEDHAATGILDPDRAHALREEALAAYERYLTHHPGDSGALLHFVGLLVEEARYQDAVDMLEPRLSHGDSRPELIILLMKSHFRLGNFERIREVARQYRELIKDEEFSLETAEAVRLWSEEINFDDAQE